MAEAAEAAQKQLPIVLVPDLAVQEVGLRTCPRRRWVEAL